MFPSKAVILADVFCLTPILSLYDSGAIQSISEYSGILIKTEYYNDQCGLVIKEQVDSALFE